MKQLILALMLLWATAAYGIEIDHDANDAVDIAHGGTNATTAAAARTNLGVATSIIGTPTYDSIQDHLNNTQGSGIISGGEFTLTNGDGTLSVAAGTGKIRSVNTAISEVFDFDWNANAAVSLTNNNTNYIYVNSSGVIAATVTKTDVDYRTEVFLGKVYREGTTLHEVEAGQVISEFSKRVLIYLNSVNGEIVRATGLVTTETGDLNLSITAGTGFAGLTQITTTTWAAVDTSGADTFRYWYNDGAWQDSAVSVINATQYNNYGVGLADLINNNHYGCHFVYMHFEGDVHVVYGIGTYSTLADAESAPTPANLPNIVNDFSLYIAKIIINKTETSSFTDVKYQWTSTTTTGLTGDHGGLSGLADDDHTQYGKISGTPVNNQIGVWTDDRTLEGTNHVQYNGIAFLLGVEDSTEGRLSLWGNGNTVGSLIYMGNSADEDGTVEGWQFGPNGLEYWLGPDTDLDAFIFASDSDLGLARIHINGAKDVMSTDIYDLWDFQDQTGVSGTHYAGMFQLRNSPAAASSAIMLPLVGLAEYDSASNSTGHVVGVVGWGNVLAETAGASTIAGVIGVEGKIGVAATKTVTSAVAIEAQIGTNEGTITEYIGVHVADASGLTNQPVTKYSFKSELVDGTLYNKGDIETPGGVSAASLTLDDSADPTYTTNDNSGDPGTSKFYGDSTGGFDTDMWFGVRDSDGAESLYLKLSGVNERIESLKDIFMDMHNLETSGYIKGNMFVGDNVAANIAHNTSVVRNAIYAFTAASTVTLDAMRDAKEGAVVTYWVRDDAEAMVIDPQAAEKIFIDSAALAAGVGITANSVGNFVTLVAMYNVDGAGVDGWIVLGNNGFVSE